MCILTIQLSLKYLFILFPRLFHNSRINPVFFFYKTLIIYSIHTDIINTVKATVKRKLTLLSQSLSEGELHPCARDQRTCVCLFVAVREQLPEARLRIQLSPAVLHISLLLMDKEKQLTGPRLGPLPRYRIQDDPGRREKKKQESWDVYVEFEE